MMGGRGYEQTEKQPGHDLYGAAVRRADFDDVHRAGAGGRQSGADNLPGEYGGVGGTGPLTTVISDKLRYCGTVETAEDGTITQIFAQGIGTGSGEAFQLTEDGKVMLGGKSLLGSGAYPRDLTVSSLTMTYNKDSRLFTVSMEISNQKGQRLAGGMDFQVKKLNTSESDI